MSKSKPSDNTWEEILRSIKQDRPLTTFQVSKICGVVHGTVSNWIDESKLIAYKTPGGHRRIRTRDLLVFLKLYEIPVPKQLKTMEKDLDKFLDDVPPEPENASKRVLIVEDEETVSEAIAFTLKKSFPSLEIAVAFDGFEAGKQIVRFSPDLVLLDLILPGLDGFRIMENIREDANCVGTKIIAITGYDVPEYKERMLKAGGADGFVPKPINFDNLKKQVQAALSLEPQE